MENETRTSQYTFVSIHLGDSSLIRWQPGTENIVILNMDSKGQSNTIIINSIEQAKMLQTLINEIVTHFNQLTK